MFKTKSIAFLIFEKVELLDFAGPFEVFASANDEAKASDSNFKFVYPFYLSIIAQSTDEISTYGDVKIKPRFSFHDNPHIDILIVPGGPGTRSEISNHRLIEWIQKTSEATEMVASVCTGALLLAASGLLKNKTVSTYDSSEVINILNFLSPATKIDTKKRFIYDGKIVTAGGVAAGIDMALNLVAKLLGSSVASATAKAINYEVDLVYLE